jgi:hypothetical protein
MEFAEHWSAMRELPLGMWARPVAGLTWGEEKAVSPREIRTLFHPFAFAVPIILRISTHVWCFFFCHSLLSEGFQNKKNRREFVSTGDGVMLE